MAAILPASAGMEISATVPFITGTGSGEVALPRTISRL